MDEWIQFAGAAFRSSSPLVLVALGGLLCERSGVTNIALEGLMLIGAFFAAAVAVATGNAWWGVCAGMGAGLVLSALYAVTVLHLRANEIVAATAVNLLAAGVAPFLCKIFYGNTGGTPQIDQAVRLGSGTAIALALIAVVGVAFFLRSTILGLWIRFAGEHPQSLETAGIPVLRVRWFCVLASGLLAGVGGACLSVALASSFTRDMSAGRGFMALAALIMGKWRPIPVAAACLLFGAASAAEMRLQGVVLWGSEPVPVQFIQIMPYVLTLLVLAGAVGRSRPPSALGAGSRVERSA